MTDERGSTQDRAKGADDIVARLSPVEREELLLKCWMSHDARWYMAVAQQFGLQAANKLNRAAAREEGKVEARRAMRALGLEQPASVRDCIVLQDVLAALLTRDLVEYDVEMVGDDALRFRVGRCFAHENVTRAGVADQYECGIFGRVAGWWDAFGLPYGLEPAPERCLKVQGRECAYTFRDARPARRG